MEPERPVPRGKPGTSQGGSSQAPGTRNPMKRLTREEFSIHFNNNYLSEQNTTYLCYRVESEGHHHPPVLIDSGVFQSQGGLHAEQHFLVWLDNEMLPCDLRYQVTWYISWSPCPSCAWQVVQFLQKNRHVSLSLLAARLYYDQNPQCQEGLLELWRAGAHMYIMSREGFKNCWENFVDTGKKQLEDWEKLKENYQELVQKLMKILRNPLQLLKEDIFYHQFNNRPRAQKPYWRRRTYICYQLQRPNGSLLDKGYFQTKKRRHAEIYLINKIKSMTLELDLNLSCRVTCYITWSPCLPCARALAGFIHHHRPRLSLQLFTSRLYFHWRREYQEGLQLLRNSQIRVTVMSAHEFAECWREFVDHQGTSFQPWKNLDGSSSSIHRRLEKIWGLPAQKLDGLNDAFRNLQLASHS